MSKPIITEPWYQAYKRYSKIGILRSMLSNYSISYIPPSDKEIQIYDAEYDWYFKKWFRGGSIDVDRFVVPAYEEISLRMPVSFAGVDLNIKFNTNIGGDYYKDFEFFIRKAYEEKSMLRYLKIISAKYMV